MQSNSCSSCSCLSFLHKLLCFFKLQNICLNSESLGFRFRAFVISINSFRFIKHSLLNHYLFLCTLLFVLHLRTFFKTLSAFSIQTFWTVDTMFSIRKFILPLQSESANLCALRASCPKCSRALSALVPHVPRVLRALVTYVPLALRVFLPYVSLVLRAPVFHVSRASPAFWPMWPCASRFMSPFSLRTLLFCILRTLCPNITFCALEFATCDFLREIY